jgi:hypothetical protein
MKFLQVTIESEDNFQKKMEFFEKYFHLQKIVSLKEQNELKSCIFSLAFKENFAEIT